MYRLTLADQTFELLPQRALFWFERRMLVVSDPAFGPGTLFPTQDMPYTVGGRASSINRLTTLLNFFEPDLLLILGDLVEPGSPPEAAVMDGLAFWRRQFPDVRFLRLRGQADPNSLCAELDVEEAASGWDSGPFRFQESFSSEGVFVIAGRPNPAVKFLDRREGTGAKAGCFLLRGSSLLIPSFSTQLPAESVQPHQGDRIFIVGPTEVVEIPSALALSPD